jgi:signal transduction histidine kinase
VIIIRAMGLSTDSWIDRPLRGVPFALLAMPFLPYVLTQAPTGGDIGRTLAVVALTVAWLGWFLFLQPAALRDNELVMSVYVAGIVAASAVLIARSPWFGFFCWIGYLNSFTYLTGARRYAGIVATAVLVAVSQCGGFRDLSPALAAIVAVIALVNAALVTTFVSIGQKAEERSEQRQRMLVQLAEANRRLEESNAENAGLHAQLLSQAREAGVLEERQRMAREIHDTLAQGLTGIITQLQAAEQASGDQAGWRRHVSAATRLARESLSEARRSVDALRPESLEKGRLSDALAGVAERWSALHGIAVQVTTTGTVRPVRPDAEFTLLRAAQEALANVAKHARATRVGLTLSYMDDEVALDVRDDGRGFDGSAGSTGGFGLAAMRQRVEGLSGTLQVESEPGGGTAISACVPAGPAVAPGAAAPSGPAVPPASEVAPAPAEATA